MNGSVELSNIALDLVSLEENRLFLSQLFSFSAGEWLDVLGACSTLAEVQKRLKLATKASDGRLYVTWLNYPEQGSDEEDFCVLIFFMDVEHWSTQMVFNKQYFFEQDSTS